MRILNDIAYADEKEVALSVMQVKILDDLYMLVTFSTGEQRVFDATTLLEMPAFTPLKDPTIFASAAVHRGILTWNHGQLDIGTEALYDRSFPYPQPHDLIA